MFFAMFRECVEHHCMGGTLMKNLEYKSFEYKFRDQRFYEDYYALHSIGWEYWSESKKYYHDCCVTTERQCIFQYTVSGEGVLEYNREKYRMKPGQAFLIERPGQYRYYRAKGASHWEVQFISLNLASLKIWRDITEQFGHIVEISKNSAVLLYWNKIYEIALKGKMDSFFLASGYAYQFMMNLYETLNVENKKHFTSGIVQNCVSLIQTEYMNSLSLDYLAGKCGVSVPHLSRLFRQSLQMSPIQYLNRHRIEIACSLLLRGNMRVGDVAHEVGFADHNYFTKAFKKIMGVSPQAYREKEFARIVDNQVSRFQILPVESAKEESEDNDYQTTPIQKRR